MCFQVFRVFSVCFLGCFLCFPVAILGFWVVVAFWVISGFRVVMFLAFVFWWWFDLGVVSFWVGVWAMFGLGFAC